MKENPERTVVVGGGPAGLASGHQVRILDQSVSPNPEDDLADILKEFQPDVVGVTFTSFLYREAQAIAGRVKNSNRDILTVAVGVHCSVLPKETLAETAFDMAVFEEGKETLREIVNGVPREKIDGLAFKDGSGIKINQPRRLLDDLDELPFPAWHLYDLRRYRVAPDQFAEQPGAGDRDQPGLSLRLRLLQQERFRNQVPGQVPPPGGG